MALTWRIPILLALLAVLGAALGCNHDRPAPTAAPHTAIVEPGATVADLETQLAEAQAQVAAVKAALTAARQEEAATRLWWFVGIMGLVAAAAVAVAIFVPAMAPLAIKAGLAAGACAALAATAVWLLPYLVWIGGGLVVIGAGAAILFWRLDAKSRDQVVRAVDSFKDKMPGYKDHFARFIDEDADHAITKTRERLGLKPMGNRHA